MMKPSESSDKIKSFKDLKRLLVHQSISLPDRPAAPKKVKPKKDPDPIPDPKSEKQAFLDAMADVTPLPKTSRVSHKPRNKLPVVIEDNSDAETLEKLESLIQHGSGFIVSSTPEYIEGTGFQVHPTISQRLHQGEFSIQEHIDLHGLTVESAREAFEDFMKQAVSTGKRAVLIVHGRGLSSPALPVLKTKVCEWLTSGHWRKWVIAYASARSHDGGAGATYVLLRQRPVTKKNRKKSKR